MWTQRYTQREGGMRRRREMASLTVLIKNHNPGNILMFALKLAKSSLSASSSSKILLNATNNNQYTPVIIGFPILLPRGLSMDSAFKLSKALHNMNPSFQLLPTTKLTTYFGLYFSSLSFLIPIFVLVRVG